MTADLDHVACDPRVAMDKALAEGVCELVFASTSEVKAYLMRCYALRRVRRDKSMYENGPFDEGYNTSPWDGLGFKIRNTTLRIIIVNAASIGLVSMKGKAK